MTRGTSSVAKPKAQPRQVTRACDHCRTRKTKCVREHDVASDAKLHQRDMRCANCKIAKIPCTFEKEAKPRGDTLSHVEYLEHREHVLEQILKAVAPSIDLDRLIPPLDQEPRRNVLTTRKSVGQMRNSNVGTTVPIPLHPPLPLPAQIVSGRRKTPALGEPRPPKRAPIFNLTDYRDPASATGDNSDSDEEGDWSPDNEYCNTSAPPLGVEGKTTSLGVPRFHGTSSCFSLVAATRELRITGKKQIRMDYESADTVVAEKKRAAELESKLGHKSKLKDPSGPSHDSLYLIFPPYDLLATLVDLYFRHVNIILPMFHPATFWQDIADHRHHTDPCFGGVVLAVCAVASRYCQDPRVLCKMPKHKNGSASRSSPQSASTDIDAWVDDREKPLSPELYEDAPWHSAGWKYYDRVDRFILSDAHQVATLEAVKLGEIQTLYLLYQFHLGLGHYSRGWCMLGVAIRRAQDLGAHKKNRYAERSLEGELWKRALCCLVIADREAALCARRGSSFSEYFDIESDLPLELENEYYSQDQSPFAIDRNPPRDKPEAIAAFNAHVKLSQIYELATTYLHPIDESRRPAFNDPEYPKFDVVGHFESAMAKWIEELPKHLKTPKTQENPVWRMQSTVLHIKHNLLRSYIYSAFLADNDIYKLTPDGRFHTDSLSTIPPTHFICSKIPTPSNSRAMCAMSARMIAILLRDAETMLDPEHVATQLCDAPSLVAGAFFAGRCLQGSRAVKRPPASKSANQTIEETEDTCFNDDVRFGVCADFLIKLQDRWASAEMHRESLIPSRNDPLPPALARKPSEPSSIPTLASQQTLLPAPGQHIPPPEEQILTPPVFGLQDYNRTSAEASPSLQPAQHFHQQSWGSPGAFPGQYYPDNSSPAGSSSQSSRGPKHTASSPSPPSSESHGSHYRDDPGHTWYSPSGDTGLKASHSSHNTYCSVSSDSGEQFVHPQPDWKEFQSPVYSALPTRSRSDWKASQHPPFELPRQSPPGYAVPVYVAPAQDPYPSVNRMPGEALRTSWVDHYNSIAVHNAIAPVEGVEGPVYPEYATHYPPSEPDQTYTHHYSGTYYHQGVHYAEQ